MRPVFGLCAKVADVHSALNKQASNAIRIFAHLAIGRGTLTDESNNIEGFPPRFLKQRRVSGLISFASRATYVANQAKPK
jgi:hypothetical protein